MVDLGAIARYEPRWPGVKELNLADQWRARWVDEQALSEHAPVNYVYSLMLMGDKGYVTREKGESKWGMLEGDTGDVAPDAFLAAASKDRFGVTPARIELIGFFECKATRHNSAYSAGELTVRPLYLIAAKKVEDLPDSSTYERRRFPLNEYMVALRARYPELLDYLGLAASRYAILRAKGEV